MTLPVNGYVQQVEVVVGGTLPRAGFVQPVESSGAAGLVTGSGAAGQVTFWTGAQTVSGSASLIWDNANLRLTVGNAKLYTPGTNNLFLGPSAGNLTLSGQANYGVGSNVMPSITSGNFNLAYGSSCLFSLTTGHYNTAIGNESIYSATDGQKNVGVGYFTLHNLVHAQLNTAIGFGTMQAITSGSDNTGCGAAVMNALLSGNYNTGVGVDALYQSTDGNNNTSVGFQSLYSSTSDDDNCAFGWSAMYTANGADQSCAFGVQALYSQTTGRFSCAFGWHALYATTGDQNSAFGWEALDGVTSGGSNVGVGERAGRAITTGSSNIFIGASADASGNVSNAVAIGAGCTVTASNTMRFGGSTAQTFQFMGGNNAGFNTATPRKQVDSLSTSQAQFRGTYTDNSVYVDYETTSAGNLKMKFSSATDPLYFGNVFSGGGYVGISDRAPDTTSFFLLTRSATSDRYLNAVSGGTMFLTVAVNTVASYTASEFCINDSQADIDFRIEGDSISHLLATDATATTENVIMCAAAAPAWNTMDRGVFLGDTSQAPTGNPTAGIYFWSESGAGKARGGGGTVTTWAPSGPRCGECGYDFWDVVAENTRFDTYIRKCGWCGMVYKKGPKTILHLLTEEDKKELIYS